MPKDIQEELSQLKKEKDEETAGSGGEDTLQLVLFRLDEEIYGLDIDQVKEIIRKVDITDIPNAPDYIQGLIDLRGEVVVIIDPETRFHLTRKKPVSSQHIIICKSGAEVFGIIVDEVLEILSFPKEKIDKVSQIVKTKIHQNFLTGTGIKDGEIFVVLDAAKILTTRDFDELKEITDQEKE